MSADFWMPIRIVIINAATIEWMASRSALGSHRASMSADFWTSIRKVVTINAAKSIRGVLVYIIRCQSEYIVT